MLKGCALFKMVSSTNSLPTTSAVFTQGPVHINPLISSSLLRNSQGQNTSNFCTIFKPAFLQMPSILPSSLRANGPGVPGGGGGKRDTTAPSTFDASQSCSLPQIPITSFPGVLVTRAASAKAF